MSFKKKFSLFFSGTIIAQLITVGMSPILTRLYTQEEFGSYNLYLSILGIVTVFSTLRLEFAFNQTNDDKEINILHELIKYSAIIFSALLFIICSILVYFNVMDVTILFIVLLSISVIFQSLFYSNSYILNRLDIFNILSMAKIYKSGSNGILNILFSFINTTGLGLIISNTLSLILVNYYQKSNINKNRVVNPIVDKKNEMIKVLDTYKTFPIYNIPSSFFDKLALNSPIIVFTATYGLSVAGLYGLAFRTVSMPISLISQSIGQVFLNEISSRFRNKQPFFKIIFKIIFYLALIGLPPTLILIYTAPWIFEFIFGEAWRESGLFVQIIVISLYFKFIVSPITNIFFIINKLRLLMLLQIFRGISTVTLLIYSALSFDIYTTLWIYTFHETVFYLVYVFIIIIITKKV